MQGQNCSGTGLSYKDKTAKEQNYHTRRGLLRDKIIKQGQICSGTGLPCKDRTEYWQGYHART